MKEQGFYLNSTAGCQLFGKAWITPEPPKALIVLIHGFGEHCSRYAPYIELFEKANIAFISMDHIGHGQSEGKRGVIQSYTQLLNDVGLLVDKAEELFPDTPKFLYGHSMGGNIALNYLLTRTHPFKGAIISSPWLKLSQEPNGLSKLLIHSLKYLCPDLTIKSGLNINHISTDTKNVEAYRRDPLNHGRISFRLLSSVIKQGVWAMDHIGQLQTPTLLLHGDQDHITSCAASKLAASRNPNMVSYQEFESIYHEIHNDIERQQQANTCINWLEQQLKQSTSQYQASSKAKLS
ncbi:alpha/beta hydrolase [Carboxylicivirga taeanensis]|uniref:alpha/beta hydrolase n=1 Tax=Carboxylicivirga taeanensis TaxID=1416875 RepID=UPI003F6E2C1A